MTERNAALSAFKEALPYTLPVFAGFWFIAFAYGFYMYTLGFSFLYPLFMAMFIFGGSLEFITVTMLLSPICPVADIHHCLHRSGKASLLWSCYAGKV